MLTASHFCPDPVGGDIHNVRFLKGGDDHRLHPNDREHHAHDINSRQYAHPADAHLQEKPTKRWVQLTKTAKEDFGAQLWSVRGKVYVVFVSEYPVGVPEFGTAKGMATRSAAFRIGLRFGDEVVSINEVDANKLGVLAAMETLRTSTTIALEITEAPLENRITIHPTGSLGQHFGLTYCNSRIHAVLKDSLAHRVGLEPNYTVVSVKGKSAVGKKDEEVVHMLSRALGERVPFVLSVMRTRQYERLLSGITLTTAGMCHNPKFALTTPAMLIDHDFELRPLRAANKRVARETGSSLTPRGSATAGRESVVRKRRNTVSEECPSARTSGRSSVSGPAGGEPNEGSRGLGMARAARATVLGLMRTESTEPGRNESGRVRLTSSVAARMSFAADPNREGEGEGEGGPMGPFRQGTYDAGGGSAPLTPPRSYYI